MEFIDTQAANPATDNSETVTGELDLYEELLAFVELSPEEQQRPKETQEELSAAEAAESTDTESLPIIPALRAVLASVAEPESSPHEPEPIWDSKASNEQASESGQELIDTSGADSQFANLNLSPEFIFTGALSKGVCLACGADSGVDDLFCITCGIFIDEVGSTLPSKPLCGDCGLDIVADEIFCPSCGSILPAA